jgi:CubicO group peptidase (beta-lactamase class C family)
MSKQFTNMSILLLEEEGLLSIDDDIRKYLPELPDYKTKVTIENLMAHTSGVRDHFLLMQLTNVLWHRYYY